MVKNSAKQPNPTVASQAAAGTVFDRRAVAALENSFENRGGRDAWADFGKPA